MATAAAGTHLLALGVPSRRASAAPAKTQQAAEEAATTNAFSSRPPAPSATQDAAEALLAPTHSRREHSVVGSGELGAAGIGSAVALAATVSASEAVRKKAAADRLVEEAEVY